MGISSQPNNKSWATNANLSATKEIYEHGEFNDLSTTNAASVEMPSNNIHGYEDSDIGDSLRETREMGKLSHHGRAKKVAKGVGVISIAMIGSVTLINNISNARPELEAPLISLSPAPYAMSYRFSLTAKQAITAFVNLKIDGKKVEEQVYTLKMDDEAAETISSTQKKFVLSGVFLDLKEGNYDFRIYCQFGYGKSSIYSQQGKIGGTL